MNLKKYDVIIIGAGAAGMMCAIEAGKRNRSVLLLDHSNKIGEKIRISGGGRCNFTNLNTSYKNFLSQNPHFCKSALAQYTPHDFIKLIDKHQIAYHEKKLGQLFCDGSAQQIIDMLLKECETANVEIFQNAHIINLIFSEEFYHLNINEIQYTCSSLVVATGGLSIPKIGASGFGYDIARKFSLNIIPTSAALVPLTFNNKMLENCKKLTGLSIEASVSCNKIYFLEGMLFTHKGLSGPSILQISSYWKKDNPLIVNLCPGLNISDFLKEKKKTNPKQKLSNILSLIMPARLAQSICNDQGYDDQIANIKAQTMEEIVKSVSAWQIHPIGTEGYRTAEVTLGGVDTKELSSKTFEAKKQGGLYFIGEVVDVTGHLGGFNFQWAWSSGYCAGQYV